jgi:hypothetical protein
VNIAASRILASQLPSALFAAERELRISSIMGPTEVRKTSNWRSRKRSHHWDSLSIDLASELIEEQSIFGGFGKAFKDDSTFGHFGIRFS